MKISILNKNLLDSHTSKIYNVDEPPVISNAYNETLDSGTIIIDNQTDKIEVSPFDIVALLNDDYSFIKYMCVDTYTEQMTCVYPKIYKYEIKIFSETKLLEGIILPNLKITKVWGQRRTIYHYIKQYMEEYCPYIRIYDEQDGYKYLPKFRYEKTQTEDSDEYALLEELENKFDNDECPEMQWNSPNLREVLNDLMMVKDCIPILKNGVLYFIDLTETKEDISSDNHINYVTRSQSSEDYVSEIHMKLENVTNKTENINNLVIRKEYVPFNIPENSATMTTENIVLRTQYPIYNLKKLVMMIPSSYIGNRVGGGNNVSIYKWDNLDLMNINYNGSTFSIVYEHQQWMTKNIRYGNSSPSFENWPKYQNWTLYYTRGSNEISNFNSKSRFWWMTYYLQQQLCREIADVNKPDYVESIFDGGYDVKFYMGFFEVEYETYEGCVFRASKNNKEIEHEKIIIDNQTNSMIDSYAQGNLEYQKSNRLGNPQLQINARYPIDYDGHIISIGDVYNGSIVYQCEYQYFTNHIEVNAYATEDYVLRNYFTGVKSRIRSWSIVSGSEALTRHDLVKHYCEFSYEESVEEHGLGELLLSNVAKYFSSSLDQYDCHPIKCAFVRTFDSEIEAHPSKYPTDGGLVDSYYYIDLMSRLIGNSLVFTIEFKDNVWAGQSVHTANDFNGETLPARPSIDVYVKPEDLKISDADMQTYNIILDSDALKGTGLPMYQQTYTDENGETEQYQIIFGYDFKIIPTFWVDDGEGNLVEDYYNDVQPGDFYPLEGSHDDITNNSKYFIYYNYQRPRVYEGNFRWHSDNIDYDYSVFSVISTHYKDSQEIANVSVQIEFISNTTDICFSKEFIRRQQAINTDTNSDSDTFYLSISNKDAYNFKKPDVKPSEATQVDLIRKIIWTPTNGNAWITFVYSNGTTYYTEDEATGAAQRDAQQYAFYLEYEDSNDERKLLLSFRNVPITNCVAVQVEDVWYPAVILHMNILRTRNKNIYDPNNHYLIVGKI